MKKNQILALGAVAALAVSCNGGGSVSTNVKLNTSMDTLAYAYGVELGDKGLDQYLQQMGVLADTAMVRNSYSFRIESEADAAKKTSLEKELIAKLDSINKANETNLAGFLSGLKDAMDAPESKAAYFRGIEIGSQLNQMAKGVSEQVYGKDSKEKINKSLLLAGVVTSLKKEKALVENAGVVVEEKMQKIQDENLKKEHGTNIEAEKKFLDENKSKEGIVTLPNGMQYKIVKEGTGAKPLASDKVKVHYHGTLLDGTVFDSSEQRGEPAEFGVNQVIKGWTEALQLMPVGSKWILYIPAELAYQSRAAGSIPPFSMLTFEVELLSIEK